MSPKNKFFLLIENKIYSGERAGKLKKYRNIVNELYAGYNYQIYIYLSLKDQIINEEEAKYYVQLNYSHIIKLLERILLNPQLNLADKTKFVFEQYLRTLKSMLNQNKEIEEITKSLYRKYRSAFDLVFKYNASTETTEIGEILNELIKSESIIKDFHSNKTYLRFQPNFLYENSEKLIQNGLLTSLDDLKDNWVYLFEFNVRNSFVKFDLKIGRGDQKIREKLYNIYSKNKNFFQRMGKKEIAPEWHLSFQKMILTQDEILSFMESGDTENVREIITARFRNLIDNDLAKYLQIINEEIS